MLADPALLATLPAAELAAGYAEVVKTALIAGGTLWERVGAGAPVDERVITACARTKLRVVAADERDAGARQVLNLGHTVAHAIETATGYARLRHGEAVGLGLLAALRLSGQDELRGQVAELLAAAGLPCRLVGAEPDAVVAAIARDKKRTGDDVPYVLVAAPGRRADRTTRRARRGRRGRARVDGIVTMQRARVAILHGVNLDQLGRRDPAIYGDMGFDALERYIGQAARELGLQTRFFQTNAEHEFVEHLHRARELADGIVLNAGAWTHYAWAIHDALEIAGLPAVEVHLSDVASREPWRRTSVVRDLCLATISGQGPEGYRAALAALKRGVRPAVSAPVSTARADRLSERASRARARPAARHRGWSTCAG